MYASETIQNCKNPTGHIDTLRDKSKITLKFHFDEKAPSYKTEILSIAI